MLDFLVNDILENSEKEDQCMTRRIEPNEYNNKKTIPMRSTRKINACN